MGELYKQVEQEFSRLRSAIEESTGVDLSEIEVMTLSEMQENLKGTPYEVDGVLSNDSPLFFWGLEPAGLVVNEQKLVSLAATTNGFNLGFYVLHELCHGLQWKLGRFQPVYNSVLERARAYAPVREAFVSAEKDSPERAELFERLEGMIDEKVEMKEACKQLQEGFAVYFQLHGLDLKDVDEGIAFHSGRVMDDLCVYAATGDTVHDILLPGWKERYCPGYHFFRKIIGYAEGDISVLEDVIQCSPTSLEEIKNPKEYWEQTLQPYREQKDS